MKQEPAFVVCGEALMDVYQSAAITSGSTLDARVGGSPFNVAIGLARLGQSVAFSGCLSLDAFGARLFAALGEEGIDTRAVARSSAPTTLSIVGVDAHGAPAYEFHGETGADRQLSLDSIELIPSSVVALHVGSYSMVVEPIASTLRALVESPHRSLLVSWDPNVRATVVREVDRWRELLDWMLPRTHLLKLSDEDLAVLCPGLSPRDFGADALSRGVGLVVVTHGSRGASAWSSAGEVHVPAEPVNVVDTVGAGDSFQAALLTWLAEHGRLTQDNVASLGTLESEAALSFATRAAAFTCARRGAALPRREEIL